jgi:hypothetical protein
LPARPVTSILSVVALLCRLAFDLLARGGRQSVFAFQADLATAGLVVSSTLVDLITKLRDSGAWFGPRSEEFLDSLLRRARAYASAFISAKKQRWLDDLVRKAKEAMP